MPRWAALSSQQQAVLTGKEQCDGIEGRAVSTNAHQGQKRQWQTTKSAGNKDASSAAAATLLVSLVAS